MGPCHIQSPDGINNRLQTTGHSVGASQSAEPKEPDKKEHIPFTWISKQANLTCDSGSQGCGYQVAGCRGEVCDWRGVGLDAWGLDGGGSPCRYLHGDVHFGATLICVVRGGQGYLVSG